MKETILEFNVANEGALEEVCSQILAASNSHIFLLVGDLGAGKTTLTKCFGRALQLDDEVSSPSYSIINEYQGPNSKCYHIDLYRLETIEEAMEIGIEEYLNQHVPCFIEWPQIISPLLPESYHTIEICILDKDERKIIFS